MISAIRAAPLRVLFLAVAVVGLMTVTDLPSASPVHAQEQAVTATRDATGESPPARPTDLQASAEPDSVSLTWTASTDQTVTHYAVLLRDRDEDDAGVFEVIDSNAGSATSYTDRSVSPGGSYVYRVKAVSPTGVSQWSSYARADIPADPEDLAPSGLSAKEVFDGGDSAGVELAWDAPAVDAESVTGYEILRAVGDGDLATLAADTGSADTTYTDDTATEAGERYAYRVKALRGEETSQPSDRAEASIPKVTTVDPERGIAEEQSGTTAWVSNTAQTVASSVRIVLGNTDKRHSQGFTTGAEPGGYSLGSVGVYVDDEDLESGETFTVHIYTANADGAIDTLVHTLISPDSYADDAVNLFTAPADATLAPNTDYLVVFEATGNAADDFALGYTVSTSEDSGSATGWSIEDSRRFDNSLFGTAIFVISVNAAAAESAEVWSATFTPVAFSGDIGCTGEADNSNEYCSAAMTDDSFEYDGTSYTIYSLLDRTNGDLQLGLNVNPTDATIADLTLNVGGSPFPLSDATLNGSLLVWANSGLTLTAGTDVTVSLTQEATAPVVSNVDVTSDPGGDDTYAIGDTVQVTVTFDQAVTVDTSDGTPRIQLRVGGGEDEHLKWADYLTGTGAAVVQFTYIVLAGDFDDNGIDIAADELELNGGTIQSSGGTDANLDYPQQGTQSGHKVDGVRPIPEFAATSVDGNSVFIIFSETLSATTAPASAFTLSVDTGTAPTVSTATASGDKVTLALASALTSGQAVTVAYIDPTLGNDSVAVQDAAGNDAANFTQAVTNNVPIEVPADWGLIPSGLGAGDRFRLLFVSSTTRDATSTDIADYNTFVQTAAASGHTDIQSFSENFKVLASTASVAARDNTTTTGIGVAIYWLNGNQVADDYGDFYDGSWDSNAPTSEDGTNVSTLNVNVWSGSNSDGTISSWPLGTSRPRRGDAKDPANELTDGTALSQTLYGLYGLSGVFVVAVMAVTSDDATLSALSLSGITLSPSFAADTLTYTASVDNAVTSTTVTATANDDGATVAIVPADADDTADDHQVTLGVGDTTVSVTVTAEDGTTMQTYAMTVTRAEAVEVKSIEMRRYDGDRNDEPYRIGDELIFVVEFSHDVACISSSPTRVRFDIGTSRKEATNYASTDSNKKDWHRYIVQEGDLDTDGITIPAGPEALPEKYTKDSCTGPAFDETGIAAQGPLADRKVDGVRPIPEFAATSVDGNSIFFIFSEPLSATTAPANAFTLSVDTGTAPTISTATASGDTVTLGLASALTSDQAVTVAYVDATSGDDSAAVQDAAGNDAANFTRTVSNAVGTGCSIVAGCYLVSADWRLIPSGLAAGAEFRLVFFSSTTRNATPTDIADYNTFVQDLAAAGHADIQPYSSTFRVVGSTADVDARDNTATTYTADDKGVAIYWLGGNKVADEYEDFYDGDWDDEANRKSESGSNVGLIDLPFTGSDHDGTEAFTGGNSSALGAGTVRVGRPNSATSGNGPLSSPTTFSNSTPSQFYGLSPVFRVAAGLVVVTNTAPAFTTGAAFSTDENQTASFQVTAMDADAGDDVTYAVTGGADLTHFQINATGRLDFASLDYENPVDAGGNNTYMVTVTATGGTGARALTTDQAITVTVTDVDEPPSAPAAPTVSAVDGSSDSLSVTWIAPPNAGKPAIDSYDLQYRKGTTGNFADGPQDVTGLTDTISGLDADSLYQVQVRATNNEGDSAWSSAGSGTTNASAGLCLLPTDPLWIACLTAGQFSDGDRRGYQGSPSIGSLAPATFDVGTTTYTVTHLFHNSGDSDGDAYVRIILSPILSEDDAGSLTLHLGDDTSLSFGDATYSASTGTSRHSWSLSAALGWSTGDAIVVGITQEEQVNTDPSFLMESSTREVAENSAAGVDVGDPVTAIDTDTGDTLTYTLEGTDAASFAIVSTSGQIRTETGVTYDHEAQPEYSVTVKADDGNGGTDTIAVTIDIADVDEPPSAPAAPTVSAVSGTTDSLEVTWTAPDNSGKPDIASYDLQYRKGTTGNWIDSPQDVAGTSATIGGLDEDSAYQVQVRATNDEGDSGWSSPGSGTTNASAQTPGVLTLGAPGGIYAIGKTLSVTVTFSAAVTVSGTPQLALDIGGGPRQADYESGTGTESLLFSYTVVEDDEDTDGIGVPADSLTLNGGTITAGGIAATLTHLPYAFGAVLVDGIRPTLLSAATSVDGTKVIATFSEDISSADHAEFNVGGAPIASATVAENVVTLALGFTILHGQSLILDVLTGAVQDAAGNGNDVVSQAITNNVPEPNAPPEFTSAASFSVAENQTAVGTVRATDEDAADTVSYAVTGGADQARFDFDTSSGVLTFKDAPDYEDPADSGRDNTYLVTVTATGGTGDRALTTDQAITVTVTDVDEPTDPTDADNLTATAHTGKIRLEWTGSADAYEFRRQEDGGDWSDWTAAETRGWFVLRNATTLDDYDVLAETTYTYQVRGAGDAANQGEDSATLGPPITLRLGATEYRVDEGAGELFFTVLAETPVGLGRYDRDIRPSFTSAGVVGPLPEGPLVKTQEDYELLIESLRIEPGDFVLVNGMYVASRLRSVGIVDDTLVEGDETFELRLLLAGGVSRFFTLGAGDGRAEVTIVDNDQTSAAPAAGNPLTGFELVDATAHLDVGAVEDGAMLTGIDPAKLYGFRANVASGAELKSVRLELSGPGPDDRVARTDNDEPYALHGDSGGHEHGAALAAGSYTLTATAHSEKDGGGSELGTLSVEFTVAGEPLTARFEGLPEGTHGGAGETFSLRLSFSEAVSTTPEALRDHALEVTNAAVEAVSRVDDRSDLWEVRLTPESDAMVTVSLLPAADCDAAGAVCTEDGRMLSVGVARVILGPPPNSPATGQPSISGTAQVGSTLTADTSGIVDQDGLDNVTFSYQWMADDANIQGATGSSYTLADRDKGKTIKVIVSFTDDANNEESLPSAATDAVAALTVPGRPLDLVGEATAQEIKLTWKAPTGDTVVEYVVYRGILQNGSMNGQALSKYTTIDAAGKAMTYTDDNVEEGVEYRYRVAAVNSDGEGKKSTWLDIAAE